MNSHCFAVRLWTDAQSSGLFDFLKRRPNFRWPLVFTQGGQTKFSYFFLWWHTIFCQRGHGMIPPKYANGPISTSVYKLRSACTQIQHKPLKRMSTRNTVPRWARWPPRSCPVVRVAWSTDRWICRSVRRWWRTTRRLVPGKRWERGTPPPIRQYCEPPKHRRHREQRDTCFQEWRKRNYWIAQTVRSSRRLPRAPSGRSSNRRGRRSRGLCWAGCLIGCWSARWRIWRLRIGRHQKLENCPDCRYTGRWQFRKRSLGVRYWCPPGGRMTRPGDMLSQEEFEKSLFDRRQS